MELTKIKPFLVGCIVLGALTFAGIIVTFIIWANYTVKKQSSEIIESVETARKNRTAETVGVVTNFEEKRRVGNAGNTYYVSYEFSVNGKTYDDQSPALDGSAIDFRKGVEGKVCYDPAKLGNSQFYLKRANYICGQ